MEMKSFESKMSDYLTALPIEIIHQILDHIPTMEILLSFSLVNKSLRSIALTHPCLRPDFHWMKNNIDKKQFDNICTQLSRSILQIVSLTLFDQNDPLTPIKNALFFSRFIQINQRFSNLRSLTLTYITYDTWYKFKDRISSHLTTFSIHLVHIGQRADISMTSNILTELFFVSLLLEHLSIKMSNYSDRMIPISLQSGLSLRFLRYFRLENITIDLSVLSILTPLLRTFEINHQNEHIKFNYILFQSLYLQRLHLQVRSLYWTEIEIIFSSFSQLNYFIVIVDNACNKLGDGFLWATVLRNIKYFQMKLSFDPDIFMEHAIDLNSFRTKFWLEEKKWLVTYQRNFNNERSILYTNPSLINDDLSSTIVGIISSESTRTSSIHCMTMNYQYFKHTLLHCYIHKTQVDLLNSTRIFTNTFKNLVVYHDTLIITTQNIHSQWMEKSPNELIEFLSSNTSHIHALSISVDILKYLYLYKWYHITDLRIENDLINGYQLSSLDEIETLYHAFPYIKRLDIHSTSTTILPQLLKKMKKTLIDVIIRQPLSVHQEQQFITRQWIEHNIEQTHIHYTCDSMNSVTLWL